MYIYIYMYTYNLRRGELLRHVADHGGEEPRGLVRDVRVQLLLRQQRRERAADVDLLRGGVLQGFYTTI